MQDRPTSQELLEAAAQFVEREIIPATEGRRQFQSRVVANVLRIVAREIAMEEQQLFGETAALAGLLDKPVPHAREITELRKLARAFNEELSTRIRSGDANSGAWRAEALRVVRSIVEDKLRIANPRYLEADLAARTRKAD
jgi:enoyl-CoA hydratase/carnithine racemase